MISENDREWSLECKLGISTGDFTTIFGLNRNDELKKGRLIYDKISKRFTAFHYNANHELRQQVIFVIEFGPNSSFFKAQFGVHKAYVGTSFCAKGDDYRIWVGNPNCRIKQFGQGTVASITSSRTVMYSFQKFTFPSQQTFQLKYSF